MLILVRFPEAENEQNAWVSLASLADLLAIIYENPFLVENQILVFHSYGANSTQFYNTAPWIQR